MASPSNLTAIIDGDILIYQAAAATERPIDWGDGLWTLHSFLPEAIDHFEDTIGQIIADLVERYECPVKAVFALSDRERNFRKSVWPAYKANRKDKRSPLCRGPLYDHILKSHATRMYPGLEADDVIGLLMTLSSGDKDALHTRNKVCVTVDKDLKTIPGDHYDFRSKESFHITKSEADYWWMFQTLVGDASDGYPGCPKIGNVTAARVLEGLSGLPSLWERVKEQYLKAGLTEEYALIMARLAHICRKGDYDLKKGEVILWEPPMR